MIGIAICDDHKSIHDEVENLLSKYQKSRKLELIYYFNSLQRFQLENKMLEKYNEQQRGYGLGTLWIANTCFAYNELMDLKCKCPNISLI